MKSIWSWCSFHLMPWEIFQLQVSHLFLRVQQRRLRSHSRGKEVHGEADSAHTLLQVVLLCFPLFHILHFYIWGSYKILDNLLSAVGTGHKGGRRGQVWEEGTKLSSCKSLSWHSHLANLSWRTREATQPCDITNFLMDPLQPVSDVVFMWKWLFSSLCLIHFNQAGKCSLTGASAIN